LLRAIASSLRILIALVNIVNAPKYKVKVLEPFVASTLNDDTTFGA
jgi:hypothetical protein